jgi:predicted dehydrogenase
MRYNIALVGCGAIAKGFYLPALAKHRAKFDKAWLIDLNDAALSAASAVVRAEKAHQLSEIADELQFVVVATPNSSHFPLAWDALLRGAHVLIEKPYVIRPGDGRKLIQLAAERGRIVAVNQTRRFFPHARELRQRISAGEFGALKSVVHLEGEKLAWPFESGAAFARTAQRTGVIMDLGVHVLDFYHYLLRPSWAFVSAIHDGFEGPEGLATLNLEANGAPVKIRLSRYQKQKNTAQLYFERATLHVNIHDLNAYAVEKTPGAIERVIVQPMVTKYEVLGEQLLANFVAAGLGQETPGCDAASSTPVIELLDKIYLSAGRYPAKIGAV